MKTKFDATVQTDQGDYNIYNYFDTDHGCDGVEVFEWWDNSYKYLGNILHVTLSVTDDEALTAFKSLARTEGIIPALESSHALGFYIREAEKLDPESCVVINLSGRGDKDLPQLLDEGLI